MRFSPLAVPARAARSPVTGSHAASLSGDALSRTPTMPQLTIAIIDSGFSLRELPSDAYVEWHSVAGGRFDQDDELSQHGTRVAQLLIGSRDGTPGAAPGHHYILIDLPRVCSEAEEIAAFEYARARNAAIVCCAWGLHPLAAHRGVSPRVAAAIERLATHSRQRRGAVVCFAVRERALPRRLDDFSDHRLVFGVEARADARTAFLRSASAQTALFCAVQCLASAGPSPSAAAPSRVPHDRPRAALSCVALPSDPSGACDEQLPGTHLQLRHERRFEGGEHSFIGYDAACRIRNLYLAANKDPDPALFGGTLAAFNPAQLPGRVWTPAALRAVDQFLLASPSPALRDHEAPFRTTTFAHLLGMAADHAGSPSDLQRIAFFSRFPGSLDHADTLRGAFDRQMEGIWQYLDAALQRSLTPWVSSGVPLASEPVLRLARLAHRNYPHFAGDNLLFYLSYHLVAVHHATKVATAANDALAQQELNSAMLAEAFALHFLADTFSSGHARVPRWAWMHATPDPSASITRMGPIDGDFFARLLHQAEGTYGVLLTNAAQMCWLGFGDSRLFALSDIYDWGANAATVRFATSVLGFEAAPPGYPLQPVHLACSVATASLADVLRHTAQLIPERFSALGGPSESTGLLGYVLRHSPYALPPRDWDGDRLQKIYGAPPPRTLGERLRDQGKMHAIYANESEAPVAGATPLDTQLGAIRGVEEVIKRVAFKKTGFVFFDLSPAEFAQECQTVFEESRLRQWIELQAEHIAAEFTTSVTGRFPNVPGLITGARDFPATPCTDGYQPPAGLTLPDSWRSAVPQPLLLALTDPAGTWGAAPT